MDNRFPYRGAETWAPIYQSFSSWGGFSGACQQYSSSYNQLMEALGDLKWNHSIVANLMASCSKHALSFQETRDWQQANNRPVILIITRQGLLQQSHIANELKWTFSIVVQCHQRGCEGLVVQSPLAYESSTTILCLWKKYANQSLELQIFSDV